MIKSICVYAGSNPGQRPEYMDVATSLGQEIASRGWRLIYGGGVSGQMGAIADGALEANGEVVGVTPKEIPEQYVHDNLTLLHNVPDMHTRKRRMFDEADAIIALPGGLGTLEELLEVWTWAQLRQHEKPIGILNVAGYYDGLISFLEHGVSEEFIRTDHLQRVIVKDKPEELLDQISLKPKECISKWGIS